MEHEVFYLREGRTDVQLISYRYVKSKVLWNLNTEWEPALRPAVIVCPGGAYSFLTDREGEMPALCFLQQGFDAFVLKYSLNEESAWPGPLDDLSLAIWFIRQHAAEWRIDPDKIALCGFSAGAHLAALSGTEWNLPGTAERLGIPEGGNRPNAMILGYMVSGEYIGNLTEQFANAPADAPNKIGAMLTEPLVPEAVPTNYISRDTAPAFIWQAREDYLDVRDSIHFAERMYEAGVPYELHIFGNGGHGMALATEMVGYGHTFPVNTGTWFPMASAWLKDLFGF